MHYFSFLFQLPIQFFNLLSESALLPGKLVYQSLLFFQLPKELAYIKISQSKSLMVFLTHCLIQRSQNDSYQHISDIQKGYESPVTNNALSQDSQESPNKELIFSSKYELITENISYHLLIMFYAVCILCISSILIPITP